MPREPSTTLAKLQIEVRSGAAVRVISLPASGRLVLGRAADADIRIDEGSLSRHHAALHVGESVWIEDLGSVNGVLRSRSARDAPSQRDTPALRLTPGEKLALVPGEAIFLGAASIVLRPRSTPAGRSSAAAPIVESPLTQVLHERARRAAQGDFSVLLLGETGTGKEVLARTIHTSSPRSAGPFMTLNCAALPESLLEAELFGYERGAFSGAVQARPGLFEAAKGGTVLLDEIGEMPFAAQARLLRVLEQREVVRLGAREPRSIDVRFVSATNRDLDAEVARGTFRQDLLYRLNAVTLTLPPLRERPEEISPLAERFLELAHRTAGRRPPVLSAAALAALVAYPFPGNARELRNAMDHAAAACEEGVILPEHLPPKIAAAAHVRPPSSGVREVGLALAGIERRRIQEALEACGGNQTRAAEVLGISRRTLVGRLSDYEMSRPRKRA